MKFLTLTESRRNKDTRELEYKKVQVNFEFVAYIQDSRPNIYICFGTPDKFMFVKESFADIQKMLADTPEPTANSLKNVM